MSPSSNPSPAPTPAPRDSAATHLMADAGNVVLADGLTSSQALALKLATSDGSIPHLTGEIRDLMQVRLKEVALLVTVGWSFVLLLCLSRLDGLFNVTYLGLSCTAAMGVAITAFLVCAVMLSRGRRYPLPALRWFEAVYLWGAVICAAWVRVAAVGRALSESPHDPFKVLYASALSNLIWMTVLVIYGIFAPNTWRRLVTMTAAIATVLLGTEVGLWFGREGVDRPLFISNLLITLMALFLGVGIALYGSFKLSAAQQEAVRARQQLRELGRYRLRRQLGSGAMGEVYLAEHMLLRRPCAVKLIRPDKGDGGKLIARFAREVQATASLTHPNTVEIYDYGRAEDGTFYYAMEYLPGLTLDEFVEKHGPLPPARVIHLLRQVCGALREAHGVGLIHRDIKPANIIVCSRGGVPDVVKLLDFGLVRVVEGAGVAVAQGAEGKLTQEGAIAGTPEYMSPEQAEGIASLDGRSDIYSLGGVAYFLLTGQPPFRRPSVLQILFAHMREPVVPPRDVSASVPADLDQVVRTCLEKGRDTRFADVGALDAALAGCETAGAWSEAQAADWWAWNEPPADISPGADDDLHEEIAIRRE